MRRRLEELNWRTHHVPPTMGYRNAEGEFCWIGKMLQRVEAAMSGRHDAATCPPDWSQRLPTPLKRSSRPEPLRAAYSQ